MSNSKSENGNFFGQAFQIAATSSIIPLALVSYLLNRFDSRLLTKTEEIVKGSVRIILNVAFGSDR